jgi:hypothetical protein
MKRVRAREVIEKHELNTNLITVIRINLFKPETGDPILKALSIVAHSNYKF